MPCAAILPLEIGNVDKFSVLFARFIDSFMFASPHSILVNDCQTLGFSIVLHLFY